MNTNQLKDLSRVVLVFSILVLMHACTDPDPLIEKGDFRIGQGEWMSIATFDPPDTVSMNNKIFDIDLDEDDEYEIRFGFGIDDYGRLPSFETWIYSKGDGTVLFQADYEEHEVYLYDSIYVLEAEVEMTYIDTIFYYFYSFDQISDSIYEIRGKTALLPFNTGDSIDMNGPWQEHTTIRYHFEGTNRQFTILGSAFREPVSYFVRNDTTFSIFRLSEYVYSYENRFDVEGGRYICFKWDDGTSERLGWVKLRVVGKRIIIYEYAIEPEVL